MGVNLGRRNIHMAKHHLDRSKIRTPFQQMTGEGMAQEVRRDSLPDPRLQAIALQILPEPLAAHLSPGAVDEEKGAFFAFGQFFPGRLQVLRDPLDCLPSQGDNPFLRPLSVEKDIAPLQVDLIHGKSSQLGNPHSCGIEQLQHGPIPGTQE